LKVPQAAPLLDTEKGVGRINTHAFKEWVIRGQVSIISEKAQALLIPPAVGKSWAYNTLADAEKSKVDRTTLGMKPGDRRPLSDLGLVRTTAAIRPLGTDEKGSCKIATVRGLQNSLIISESGLLKLIMRSSKPVAKQFQNWVTGVGLPAIRKDGGYIFR
jgi:hypothetical protein